MHSPLLVEAAEPILTTAEAKKHLNVDFTDDDALIDALVEAATVHVQRKCGVLLGEQTWRQDFDSFWQKLRLPHSPVTAITSVVYLDEDGQSATVNASNYELFADALGSFVRFKDSYSLPSNLYQIGAVRVTFEAGYEEVPAPLLSAVKLILGDLYADREAKVVSGLVENPTVTALISTYRRYQ
jgi:uncharacterized phiE125 gp8 family phage protein